jgi:phosphoglucosamine mutase
MKRQYFGTDGVRGPYGGPLINEAFAERLALAAGRWRQQQKPGPTLVLIGRDTRFSGASLEAAIIAGLAAAGLTPISLGVIPTPAVSRAVREQGAALGVVITASHNPAADNGIKFFGPGGLKLTDEEEAAIEGQLEKGAIAAKPSGKTLIRSATGTDAATGYVAATAQLLPAGALRGWRIVLDTANGATCTTSPAVLRQLGAEVIGIGDAPDGRNINDGVGSEHPESLGERVRREGARLGIAHDGDGDRCVLCDERGDVLDGDEVLTILATHALAQKTLVNSTLVITVQSNLGVDAAVSAAGGKVLRTPVGDRYVSECMRAEGAMLGGESSGHIICAEVGPTGDGLVAALKVLGVMLATGQPLSELRRVLKKFPQRTRALEVREKKPFGTLAALGVAMAALEAELGARGRVLVRYSGTEPKLRLLIEGPDDATVDAGLARLEAAARTDLEVL